MSLIQDALKRKAEDSGIPPPAPMSRYEPRNEAAKKVKKTQTFVIILVTLLIAVLITGGIGLTVYLIKPSLLTARFSPKAAPADTAQDAPIEIAATKPDAKEPPAPKAPVVWPTLELTGIARGASQSMAIINGKMLETGRTIDGVKIIDVQDDGVIVECGGERRTLHIEL